MSVAPTSPLTEDGASAVAANSAFAFDLYGRLRRADANVLFSPASISSALVMAFAGAAGRTAEQMAAVLHLDLAAERAIRAWAEIGASLARRSQRPGVALEVANAAWAQEGLLFRERFLALVRQTVGQELHRADFATAAERARGVINHWVAERTHERTRR